MVFGGIDNGLDIINGYYNINIKAHHGFHIGIDSQPPNKGVRRTRFTEDGKELLEDI
jgi:hypothetical protein